MQTLRTVAVLTAVGGVGGIIALRNKKLKEISGSPFFREAFKILRAHEGMNTHSTISSLRWGMNCGLLVQVL